MSVGLYQRVVSSHPITIKFGALAMIAFILIFLFFGIFMALFIEED